MKYKKYTIDTIHEIIKDRPIKFISKEYTRIDFKHEWQCNICNHIWQTTPHHIKNGTGCPKCAGKAYTKKEIKDAAIFKNIYLTGEFTKMTSKTEWKCADGHSWSASPFSVITKNTGCPKCRVNIREEKCRFIFESLTFYKFPKDRTILSGKELDGYCSELNLAFEYQGQQHYKNIYFHRPGRDLKTQQERDKQKRMLCKKLGIILIEIPYAEENLERFITRRLSEEHISGQVDWDKFSFHPGRLNELKEILLSRNIQCLSTSYLGDSTKLKLKCVICSYKWQAAPTHLKSTKPTGCPKCGRKRGAKKREGKKSIILS